MALRPRDNGDAVVSLGDDLSWGPVEGDLAGRAAYFETECPIPGGWQWLPEAHAEFWTAIDGWPGERLIWLGANSACEHAGYLAYLDHCHDRPAEVVRPDDYFAPHPVYGPAGSIGVLDAEQLADALANAPRRPVGDDAEQFGRWAELQREDALLRIVDDGRLISARVDHFDSFVTDAVGSEWKAAARVVGDALGAAFDARVWVNSDFLFSRVASLVNSGALEAQGNVVGWTADHRREPAHVRRSAI